MPIRSYLDGFRFDPETIRVMGVAFEMTRAAIHLNGQDPIDEAIAKKIIEFAGAGERSPDLLCERALDDLRVVREPPRALLQAPLGRRSF